LKKPLIRIVERTQDPYRILEPNLGIKKTCNTFKNNALQVVCVLKAGIETIYFDNFKKHYKN